MSDNDDINSANTGPAGPGDGKRRRRSRRVVGTPPQVPGLLGNLGRAGGQGGAGGHGQRGGPTPGEMAEPELTELPPSPPDLVRAKKFERLVALLFWICGIASALFMVAYILLPPTGSGVAREVSILHSNSALGACMAVAFVALGAGMVFWVRNVMPPAELVEERHPLASTPEDRAAFEQTIREGADTSQILKRPLLRRSLLVAGIPLAVAPVVLLKDLAPMPGTTLRHTVWRPGLRLWLYGSNRPIRPEEFDSNGGMITVIPAGYQDDQNALAKATAIIIKFAPGQLQPPTRLDWTVDNIVCYSKICTHVGCPVALYEQTVHKILCPCHQSTFLATKGAEVVFGPAPRSLPQLPLTTDAEGYLVAKHDFVVPVGPSFWELGGSGFHGGNETS